VKKSKLYTEDADAQLMQLFRQGREGGLAVVFERLYPALCMYGLRLVQEKAVAEDLAEEALIAVWERRAQFQSFLHLKHYCYTTVRNACFSWLRQQQAAAKQTPALLSLQDTVSNRLDDIIRVETYRALHEAIALLPAQCRDVLKLSYLEGRTIRQVAAALNIKTGTVKSQRNRGLLLLRKRLLYFISLACFL
jgi:RNA polymerase sigma factor (sigma-70 family)